MGRKKEYVLLVVLCMVFLMAGGSLFQIWEEYHEADAGYRDLQKYVIEKPEAEKEHNGQERNPERGRDHLPEIDFGGLRAVNEDIVAWIQIPGIGVDYPVVQGEDNEHYLHYTFDGKENIAGSIFLDYRNRSDFTDGKVILYGHNMQDGSMFSHLEEYQDAKFRKEQGKVLLYLPDRVLECEIVECKQVSVRDSVYEIRHEEKMKAPEQMILSTCSSKSDIRLVLKCTLREL
nr:class B sortase [uncultured Schaedlerella sp.]